MIRSLRTIAAALLLLAAPLAARADRRYYGETYNASTSPRGSLDLELWSTLAKPKESGAPRVWEHQAELETGITDHWDVALYGIARQIQGKALELEAAKLETRYRLSDPGQWFVDPVLYLEVKKTVVEDRPLSVEEKLILAKDVGRLNVSVNAAAEQEFARGEVEHDGEWAAGTSWELVPALRVGAEAFGSVANETEPTGGEKLTWKTWAGPAVSLAWSRTWLVLAAGFGLGGDAETLRLRGILAFQF